MFKIYDFPKLQSPFVREVIDGNYVLTPKVAEGMDWVFSDDKVKAVEKLDGTNVSILIENGTISAVFNRTERIPFFCKGKSHIIKGIMESYERGYMEMLPDGQHFGELIGEKVNGNPHKIEGHVWIPFSWMQDHNLFYKSFGKYPKNYEAFSEWFKTLMPLFAYRVHGKEAVDKDPKLGFVEGVVFTHQDGRMAKLRVDMWPWYQGSRHKGAADKREENEQQA